MNVSLLIRGRDQAADDGQVFERRNPLTQQVASTAAAATVSDADAAEFTDLCWITIETQPQHYPF